MRTGHPPGLTTLLAASLSALCACAAPPPTGPLPPSAGAAGAGPVAIEVENPGGGADRRADLLRGCRRRCAWASPTCTSWAA